MTISTERLTMFSDPVAGHWDTPEGTEKANEYAAMTREQLGMGHLTDFQLANAQYLVGRHDLDLLAFQTAAKERIRWLSAQLALASRSGVERREAVIEECAKVLETKAAAQSQFQKSAYDRGDDMGGHGHWKAQRELRAAAHSLRTLKDNTHGA